MRCVRYLKDCVAILQVSLPSFTTPADQAPKPQSALGEALDEYLQRTKSPENYLTMKGKLDFIHQARILKCEKTIIKCRKEQERLQKEKQEREEKRWGK